MWSIIDLVLLRIRLSSVQYSSIRLYSYRPELTSVHPSMALQSLRTCICVDVLRSVDVFRYQFTYGMYVSKTRRVPLMIIAPCVHLCTWTDILAMQNRPALYMLIREGMGSLVSLAPYTCNNFNYN